MKAQTKRWLQMAGAASALLLLLLCLHRGTPAPPPATQAAVASAAVIRAAPPRAAPAPPPAPLAVPSRQSYIVQAASAGEAASAVVRVGGKVTGDLSVIRAVSVLLDARELEALQAANVPGLKVFADTKVSASSAAGALPETYYPSEVAAQELQVGGITGTGVTVAVVDSGLWNQHGPDQSAPGRTASRIAAQYDVIAASQQTATTQLVGAADSAIAPYSANINDPYGHGTHVSSIIASSGVATTGNFQGVAPGVNLVAVRVLDQNGEGSYSNVITGIQWVMNQKPRYNIRVMNLSLDAAGAVLLLAGSAQPGGDGGVERRHRGGGGGGQQRTQADDHRRAGQRAVRDHGRRGHRQLLPAAAEPVQARLILLRRPDLRGLREARGGRHGRTHPRLRARQRHAGGRNFRSGCTCRTTTSPCRAPRWRPR